MAALQDDEALSAMIRQLRLECRKHKQGPLPESALHRVLEHSLSSARSEESQLGKAHSAVPDAITDNVCKEKSILAMDDVASPSKPNCNAAVAGAESESKAEREAKEDLEFFLRVAKEQTRRKTDLPGSGRKILLPPMPKTPKTRCEDEDAAAPAMIIQDWGSVRCLAQEDEISMEADSDCTREFVSPRKATRNKTSQAASKSQANSDYYADKKHHHHRIHSEQHHQECNHDPREETLQAPRAQRPKHRTPKLSYSSSLLVRSRRRGSTQQRPFAN